MRNLRWPDALFAYGGHHVGKRGCCCHRPVVITRRPVASLTCVCDFNTIRDLTSCVGPRVVCSVLAFSHRVCVQSPGDSKDPYLKGNTNVCFPHHSAAPSTQKVSLQCSLTDVVGLPQLCDERREKCYFHYFSSLENGHAVNTPPPPVLQEGRVAGWGLH